MWGVTDVFRGFAVGFSTFRNTEVGYWVWIHFSFRDITVILLSMLAMVKIRLLSKIRTIRAVIPNTVTTRSVRTSQ